MTALLLLYGGGRRRFEFRDGSPNRVLHIRKRNKLDLSVDDLSLIQQSLYEKIYSNSIHKHARAKRVPIRYVRPRLAPTHRARAKLSLLLEKGESLGGPSFFENRHAPKMDEFHAFPHVSVLLSSMSS